MDNLKEKSSYRIAAVVVTYRRKKFLIELLDALLKQTVKLEAIFVVDNSEDLESLKFLRENKVLEAFTCASDGECFIEDSIRGVKLFFMRSGKNIGGAGGFNLGLREAYKRGFELFWLMDDDIEPLSEALEYQLKFLNISDCITPSKKALDGEILEWWGWLDLRTLREKPIPEENFYKDYAIVNMTCFEGLLIHRKIVSRIGFPDPAFFIYGDDVVYGFKASKYTQCIYLLKPTFLKKLKKKNFHKRFGKYFPFASKTLAYYLMRNYLLKAKQIKSVEPEKVNMAFVYIYHFYYFFKQLIKAILIERDLKKLSFLIRGFFESFRLIGEVVKNR